MRDYVSARVNSIPPSGIRKFFDIAATMKDVISLGIGEPDFTTPKPILEAGIRSLQNGETHYTSNWGKLELRQAIERQLVGIERKKQHAEKIEGATPLHPKNGKNPDGSQKGQLDPIERQRIARAQPQPDPLKGQGNGG